MIRCFGAILGAGLLAYLALSPTVAATPVATPTALEIVPEGLWELQAIVSANGHETVPANPADFTIQFYPGERTVTVPKERDDPSGPDGRIGLHLDCNLGSADYDVEGNRLTIRFVLSTDMGCVPPTMGVAFEERLYGVTGYRLEGDELIFDLESGGHLRFAPAASAVTTSGRGPGRARATEPVGCQAEDRPLAGLNAIGVGAGIAPAPTPIAPVIAVPLGRQAPEDTIAAVTDTALAYLSCRDAGDIPRAAAFLTDAGARRILGGDAPVSTGRRAVPAATPVAASTRARSRLIALTDVSILADGRAAALAVMKDPLGLPHGRRTVLLLFVRTSNRWLIDDIIGFTVPTPAVTPGAGTPTP